MTAFRKLINKEKKFFKTISIDYECELLNEDMKIFDDKIKKAV